MLIALNKPYGILSQFTPEPGSRWSTLATLGLPAKVYPIGRLDADSEGLLLLTDEAALNQRLLHPSRGHSREYWVQVERIPDETSLGALSKGGISLGDHHTLPCLAKLLDPQPDMPPREPPIRYRASVPDCWLSLVLTEGKNRQVRRMTAAVGHPTLRLVRMAVGEYRLDWAALPAGRWKELDAGERAAVLKRA